MIVKNCSLEYLRKRYNESRDFVIRIREERIREKPFTISKPLPPLKQVKENKGDGDGKSVDDELER